MATDDVTPSAGVAIDRGCVAAMACAVDVVATVIGASSLPFCVRVSVTNVASGTKEDTIDVILSVVSDVDVDVDVAVDAKVELQL